MAFASLTRARVIKASKLLRAQGRKLPKVGYCVLVRGTMSETSRVELCRDPRGYYAIPVNHGLFGARRRARR
jgi:hypothetical protein